jgi:hypothetical protein
MPWRMGSGLYSLCARVTHLLTATLTRTNREARHNLGDGRGELSRVEADGLDVVRALLEALVVSLDELDDALHLAHSKRICTA